MDDKFFLDACELIDTKLVNLAMDNVFNSIGSNVFFEFGAEKEIVLKNKRKSLRKEWSIWISHASWRITKKRKYVVGSGDSPHDIQLNIQKLLGKRFQSFRFFSSFLDVEFNFDEEYRLTTFFNCLEEDQWTVFLPNQTHIGIDCSNHEEIRNIQSIAKHFPIIENYKKISFPQREVVLTRIIYDKYGQPTFHFENEFSINLENCTWRLERGKDYLVGYLDGDQFKINHKMSELIGKKLKQIGVINSTKDGKFQFEDRYILKTFACCHEVSQWKIFSKSEPIFQANIELENVH